MSDTPRTDVLLIAHDMAPTHISLISHARELERELNAANAKIKRLEEAGDEIIKLAAKHIKQLVDGGDEAIYKTNLFDREAHWNKAKEAKP